MLSKIKEAVAKVGYKVFDEEERIQTKKISGVKKADIQLGGMKLRFMCYDHRKRA